MAEEERALGVWLEQNADGGGVPQTGHVSDWDVVELFCAGRFRRVVVRCDVMGLRYVVSGAMSVRGAGLVAFGALCLSSDSWRAGPRAGGRRGMVLRGDLLRRADTVRR